MPDQYAYTYEGAVPCGRALTSSRSRTPMVVGRTYPTYVASLACIRFIGSLRNTSGSMRYVTTPRSRNRPWIEGTFT